MSMAGEWVLRAQDLATGAIQKSAIIAGEVGGTGDPTVADAASRGVLRFNPFRELQRSGLRIASGNVYIAFGGMGDNHPWHGWIMGYSPEMRQVGIWCSTPNSFGGAVWGGEPAVDGEGDLYVATGNGGPFNSDSGTYTNSLVKLSPSLGVLDWFEPSNNELVNSRDADLAANRAILIPGTNLVEIAGKDFNVYVLDKSCLGHLQSSGTCGFRTFKTDQTSRFNSGSGSYGGIFMSDRLFLPTTRGPIFAFALHDGAFNPIPVASSSALYGPFGAAQMSGSSNGSMNGIVWITTSALSAFGSPQPGTLRALDAKTLAEVWSSAARAQDQLGNLAKFSSPVVADGHVFVASVEGSINVYGVQGRSGQGRVASVEPHP
jgi:outer membrane protein assembly factor BamB